MTKPKTDESKAEFLHRFMADEDSCREYVSESVRFERGAAIWDNRGALEAANSLGYNAERDGAESFGGRHLQAGIVGYPEMKHPVTGKQGINVLIEKETIDRMRPTAKGVPVINWAHDFSGGATKWIAEGKAVGVMVGSAWDGDNAWENCEAMVWNKEAKANCRNGFHWSNAWKEDEIDWTPGVHNGMPYDGRVIAAHYTHLAIVPKPRYNGAVIYANAQGGLNAMLKLLGFGKTEAVELDKEAALEIGGKSYKALEVVNAMAAVEADKAKLATTAKSGALKDGDKVVIGGKEYSGLEVANAMAAVEKAKPPVAAEQKIEAAKPVHETPEFLNAVDARVAEILDKKVGEGFFNGIKALAERRPAADDKTALKTHLTTRDRENFGRARWGKKSKAAAK